MKRSAWYDEKGARTDQYTGTKRGARSLQMLKARKSIVFSPLIRRYAIP
jgi:hypothetical protein